MKEQDLKECIAEVKHSAIQEQSKEKIINTLQNNRWIPCSERMPEDSLNSVIGWDEFRERCCFVQYYKGRWILGNDDDVVNIIAWRPLPEPYKESED